MSIYTFRATHFFKKENYMRLYLLGVVCKWKFVTFTPLTIGVNCLFNFLNKNKDLRASVIIRYICAEYLSITVCREKTKNFYT